MTPSHPCYIICGGSLPGPNKCIKCVSNVDYVKKPFKPFTWEILSLTTKKPLLSTTLSLFCFRCQKLKDMNSNPDCLKKCPSRPIKFLNSKTDEKAWLINFEKIRMKNPSTVSPFCIMCSRMNGFNGNMLNNCIAKCYSNGKDKTLIIATKSTRHGATQFLEGNSLPFKKLNGNNFPTKSLDERKIKQGKEELSLSTVAKKSGKFEEILIFLITCTVCIAVLLLIIVVLLHKRPSRISRVKPFFIT